jgi:hypothetical protein
MKQGGNGEMKENERVIRETLPLVRNNMHRGRKFTLWQIAEFIGKTIMLHYSDDHAGGEATFSTRVFDPEVSISYSDKDGVKHVIVMTV